MDLTAGLGFRASVDPMSCRLQGGGDWEAGAPAARTLAELRPVLADPEAGGPDQVYFMYRDAGPAEPRRAARRLGLRYDLTVLRPGRIGPEYVKTFGHEHPAAPDGVAYPELYQVVAGEAWFILQDARRVRVIRAAAGDCALIPPGFGHVTVNVGSGPLVLANWVEATFASRYGPYRRRRGAAVYVVAGEAGPALRPNPAYDPAPAVEELEPTPPGRVGLTRAGEPIFTAVCRDPGRFAYLVRPGGAASLWARLDGV
ncbi:MAG TPA: glucose-6-phosphate isomerase family protein [Bacillota bacterium]